MLSSNAYLVACLALAVIGVGGIYVTLRYRKQIVQEAKREGAVIRREAKQEAESLRAIAKKHSEITKKEAVQQSDAVKAEASRLVSLAEERIDRLKAADNELVSRLTATRKRIENLTDLCCERASAIELLTEDDLLTSKEYQEDRKEVKREMKALACNSIDNVAGATANVGIGKFVTISAKADLAGALLMTTAEMLATKVTYSNAHASFEKLFETIEVTEALVRAMDHRARISPQFKIILEKRLRIEVNYKRARQAAKEVQRELRHQEREDRKARQEAEKMEMEALREEEIKRIAIAEIEQKMVQKGQTERLVYEQQLEQLKSELEDAHERLERARSRAQDTKQGHVYIISNIGSFGEDVLKVGMTRRLDPMDRVKELGDASVPFTFDVHALIESDNAPNLETTLHGLLDGRRVNKVNKRKEYFRVTVDEIEKMLAEIGIDALINRVPSADEYYQSIKSGQ